MQSLYFKIVVFLVFVFCSGIYFFSGVGLQNSGDAPQYALTQSLVERQSFYLAKDARWVLPDVGQLNGNTISGRSPGESFLGMPFYLIATQFKQFVVSPYGGVRDGIDQNSGIEAAASIGVAFFGGLSVVMVIYLARFFTKHPLAQIWAGLSFGLGTLIWKYSTTFYRHSYHTFFILLATYGLFLGMSRNKFR